MKYPQIERDDKLSVKMTEAKIIEARQLYQAGWSINKIANEFGVAWLTIAVYVNPKYETYYKDKYERLGWTPSLNKEEIQARFHKRRRQYKRKEFLKFKRNLARKAKNITPDRWRIDQPPKIKARLKQERLEKRRAYYREYQRKYRKTDKHKKWWKSYYAKQDKAELARKARERRAKKKGGEKNALVHSYLLEAR